LPEVKTTVNADGKVHQRGISSFAWCRGYKYIATCGLERFVGPGPSGAFTRPTRFPP
jgi:hypothetical protein